MDHTAPPTEGHQRFSEIRREVTPARRARIDAIKGAMVEAERLHELRKGRGMTQVEVAGRLGVSQGNVSELERRDDVYVSTLREYVEALGGRLEISAVFDDVPEQERRLIDLTAALERSLELARALEVPPRKGKAASTKRAATA